MKLAGGRLWTKEEIEYVRENLGRIKIDTIAKNLGRTKEAVISQIEKRKLGGALENTGMWTASDLARAFKIDNHVPVRWIKKEGLPAVKKTMLEKGKYWIVDPDKFWRWAKKNKHLINFAKLEPFDLLPQPEWVELERRRDARKIPRRQQKPWTPEEDEQLIALMKSGYGNKEIAERLDRSEKAVQRRISRLRAKNIIPKKKIVIRWTDEEVRIMQEMEQQGYSDEEIAYELGREVEHIRDKRRRMGYHKREVIKKSG